MVKSKRGNSRTHTHSVVGHVSGGGAELGVGLDDLVHSLQEVFLCGDLPAGSDGEHASLCANTADLSTCQKTRPTAKHSDSGFSGFYCDNNNKIISLCANLNLHKIL